MFNSQYLPSYTYAKDLWSVTMNLFMTQLWGGRALVPVSSAGLDWRGSSCRLSSRGCESSTRGQPSTAGPLSASTRYIQQNPSAQCKSGRQVHIENETLCPEGSWQWYKCKALFPEDGDSTLLVWFTYHTMLLINISVMWPFGFSFLFIYSILNNNKKQERTLSLFLTTIHSRPFHSHDCNGVVLISPTLTMRTFLTAKHIMLKVTFLNKFAWPGIQACLLFYVVSFLCAYNSFNTARTLGYPHPHLLSRYAKNHEKVTLGIFYSFQQRPLYFLPIP